MLSETSMRWLTTSPWDPTGPIIAHHLTDRQVVRVLRVGSIYIADIYHRYISDIYPIFSFEKNQIFSIFSIFSIFMEFLKYFLLWHIVTTFWFSVCVFCWLMTCALSIFSVLDNFCQISPLHSNAVWITWVLHLICNAQIHILLFGIKFHIILAMYLQMLDIHCVPKKWCQNSNHCNYGTPNQN